VNTQRIISQAALGIGFYVLLILAWLVYAPGLSGVFLFDDQPNLAFLADFGASGNISQEIGRALIQNPSSQLGRPISMLTFLWQAPSWPLNVQDFKYVNILLHLLNACLVLWVVLLLGRLLDLPPTRCQILGLIVTAFWLLHPLHVSTVLYVIQRMVEVSAFFTLAGLAAYLHGRFYLARQRLVRGYLWVTGGIGLGLVLGVLSKENGLLLALYISVLEITLLRKVATAPYWQAWRWLFMAGPVIAFVGYLMLNSHYIAASYSARDFTLVERLWSEARIGWEYVGNILFPRPSALGLFHDDYLVSRGWLMPSSTLLAVLAWASALGTAVFLRKRAPWIAFAVLWFLAGHLMESTFIGLILYFEHRNYLPMLGLLLAIAYYLTFGLDHFQAKSNMLLRIIAAIWLSLLLVITWGETTLWGQPVQQAALWAQQQPYSKFAQSHAAHVMNLYGQPDKARDYYLHLAQTFPETTGPYLLWISASCKPKLLALPDMALVWPILATKHADIGSVSALNTLVNEMNKQECELPVDLVLKIFSVLQSNPNLRNFGDTITKLYAQFLAGQKRYGEALMLTDNLAADIPYRIERIVWMIFAGALDTALTEIEQLRAQLTPLTEPLYRKQLDQSAALAHQLLEQLQQRKHSPQESQ